MPTSRNEALEFRASHAFVIGINNYPLLGANLEGAINDARAVAERLCVHQGFDNVLLMEDAGLEHIRALFQWLKSDHSKPLHIEKGTPFIGFEGLTEPYSAKIEWLDYTPLSPNIPLSEINWERQISRNASSNKKNTVVGGRRITVDKERDSVVFYFAGHGYPGVASGKGPKGYLAATDSTKDLSGKVNLEESFITMEELYEALDVFDCKHTLLILDCCFSGKFRFADAQRGGPVAFLVPMYAERFERYKQGKAWQVLASSGPNQTAADLLEAKDIRKHSPFATTLIDALEGKADLPSIGVPGNLKDGIITATELFLYVSDKVEAMTRHNRPQNPSLFPMKKHDNGEFIFVNPQLNIKQFKFNNDPRNNPYMGLKSFEKENHKLFYGRDKEIKEIVNLLTDKERIDKVLFVSGGSSAGKSSIIQAGVFQRLQIKMHTQEKTIELIKVRPTDLVETNKDLKQIKDQKRKGNKRFEEVIDKLLSKDNFLLFIDQYEEIFTHSNGPILAYRILQLFNTAISEESNYVLFSIRSDFEWKIKRTIELNSYFKRENIYRLGPMGLEDLRKALVGPAFWAMCQFTSKEENGNNADKGEDLINRILADLANAPAALSILSFTMNRMYELAKGTDRVNGVYTFTHKMYEDMGGVDGAISARADKFYKELKNEEEKDLMKYLFLRMITLYDGTYSRRRVYYAVSNQNKTFQLNELELNDEDAMDQYFSENYLSELQLLSNQDELKELIEKLAAADLIVQRKDDNAQKEEESALFYIELAHDALIRKWDQCRIWLDELEKDSLLLQRQLWDDILEAQIGIKRKIQQTQSTDIRGDIIPQTDIVLSTSSYWDNNPKLDSILKLLASDISLKAGDTVSVSGDKFGGLSQESRNLFQRFTSPLSKQSNDSLSEICADASFDSIIELFASRNHWLNEAELFFIYRSAVRKEKRYQILKAERDQAQQNALRSISNTLANIASTISDRTQAYRVAELSAMVDKNNPKALEQLIKHYYSTYHLPTHQNFYCKGFPVFSPNSEEFVLYWANRIRIFDAIEGKEIVSWENSGGFYSVCYSTDPEGNFLISAHADNKVRVWQRPENKHTPWSVVKEWETGLLNSHHISISKDGQSIAVGGDDSKIKVWKDWNTDHPKATEIAFPLSNLSKIELSKHGDFVLCSFSRHELNVQIWEVKENGKRWDLNNMPDKLAIASFADDERYVVATSWGNGLMRWDFQNDEVHRFDTKGFTGNGHDLQYSTFDNHGRLAVGAATGHLYIFQLNVSQGIIEKEIFSTKVQDANIAKIGFAPNGKYVVTSANNVTKLWNIQHYKGMDRLPMQSQNADFFPPNNVSGTPIRRTVHSPDEKKMALIYGSHGDRRFFGTDTLSSIFNWENHQEEFRVGPQSDRINDIVFKEDGQQMYLAQEDGKILCKKSNASIDLIVDFDESIDSIGIYKQDTRLIAGLRSGKVKLIKLDQNNSVVEIGLHTSRINKIAVAPNERTLLTASRCVKAWDIHLGTDTITLLENLYDDNEEKFSIEFSKDSSLFAIGGDSWLQVHETRSENNKSPLIGRFLHENRRLISQVYFSNDGSKIFSISGQIAHMWDIPAQKRLLSISPFNFLSGGRYFDTLSSTNETEFTGRGSKLLIMQEGGGVLFDFNISDILEKARNEKVIGALTPETIDLLELDDYFEAAGIYDNVFKTIKDERLLFSFGKYFQTKAQESGSAGRRNQLELLAFSYIEAASKIGKIYRPFTYESILNSMPRPMQKIDLIS